MGSTSFLISSGWLEVLFERVLVPSPEDECNEVEDEALEAEHSWPIAFGNGVDLCILVAGPFEGSLAPMFGTRFFGIFLATS